MKFITTASNYLPGNMFVETGVEIGDGTNYPLPEDYVPSAAMEGLDEEGKKLVRQLRENREPGNEMEKRAASSKAKRELEKLERENAQLREQLESVQRQNAPVEKTVLVANYTQKDGRLETELDGRLNRARELSQPDREVVNTGPDGGVTQPVESGMKMPEPVKAGDEGKNPAGDFNQPTTAVGALKPKAK